MSRKVSPLILLTAILAAACAGPEAPPAPSVAREVATFETALNPDESDLLGQIKEATARYHRVDAALDDGYARGSSCVSSVFGGKGYSYQNATLFDGVLNPSAPEILNYEPTQNGRLRLVGVTFLVRASAWDPFNSTAPTLAARNFLDRRLAGSFGPGFANYALYVSAWRDNPRGMFDQYNPNVSCDYADDAVVELIRATTTGRSVFPIGNTPAGGQGQPISGVSCISGGPPAYHLHAHVSLFVRGEQIAIPGGVGIVNPRMTNGYVGFDPTECFYEIHTHDATGIVHLHANAAQNRPLTLGNLFGAWGRILSRDDVAGNTGSVIAYVNQQLYSGDLGSIVLSNHTQVTLEVGEPRVKPPTYLFPTNP